MKKQLGKTKPVRGRPSKKSAHDSGKTKRKVSSKPLVRRKKRAYVPSAAGAAVPKGSTLSTEGDTITLPSCALGLPENQVYVLSAASAPVPEESTTATEGDIITLSSCALGLPENQAYVPSAAAAAVPEESTPPTEGNTITLPSYALGLPENQVYVLSVASAPVPEESTTRTEGSTITLPSRALVLWENQAYVPSAAAAVIDGPTTPMEGDTTTLALRALVLRKNQAYVPSSAAAAISQGWPSTLEKYWGREIIDKEKVLTIMMMPFVAWHAYQTRLERRRTAIQMLVRGCVVRPADVDLHYITSVRKLGICIEAQDSQPFRNTELTFCPVPLAAEMRARGKQLLQWLRHELAAKYLPKLWKVVQEETGGAIFWVAKPTKPRTGWKRTQSLVQ